MWLLWVTIALFVTNGAADIYMHIPRGSNNRLNERTANRQNANRLFDSQNNNKGGYNVGDAGENPSVDESEHYRMKYFQSDATGQSILTVEWTNQHGCGGNEDTNPQKQNCIIVLQYGCQDNVLEPKGGDDSFRNGKTTITPKFTKPPSINETLEQKNTRKSGDLDKDRGLHDSWDSYNKCYTRQRNQGLFTAVQNLGKTNLGYSSAIHTRQNPNGNQYGYECPEERDYYPYWHTSMWKDIAVLAENTSMCSHYSSNSFNVKPYGECKEGKGWSRWNNQADCEANRGQWLLLYNYLEKATNLDTQSKCEGASSGKLQYVWAVPWDSTTYQPQCLLRLPAPECSEAPWSRSNHLGNGVDGKALHYNWTLPYFTTPTTKRCVFRIRYNISTDDYDPYYTDSSKNGNDPMAKSPVQQNPYVSIGGRYSPLRLAINTAQYGRVFQDRSHVFLLRPRPAELQGAKIFNLNVRGKRGNIVQAFPAVEYDFAPTRMEIKMGDLVHIQWTGSNTHDNNGNSDGQTGAVGEGTAGTDRHNLVQIMDANDNFPLPFNQSTMWTNTEVKWVYHGVTDVQAKHLAVDLATAGYYRCIKQVECSGANVTNFAVDKTGRAKLQPQLNNAPASYEGVVVKLAPGTYHYMCTRNNNFSNRSQKGVIVCK